MLLKLFMLQWGEKNKDCSSVDTHNACCWKKDEDEEETHFND